jgi:hypothetical protein
MPRTRRVHSGSRSRSTTSGRPIGKDCSPGRADDRTPVPQALVCRRGERRLFHREGPEGKSLAYVYFEDEPGRRSAAKMLTRDEARRIAADIAKLPDLLRQ